ncbi:MAG: transcriptional regulator, partial [Candidatus Hodarchaeota archaeon]
SHHFRKLEEKKYVSIQKTFRNLRPHTIIKITKHGEESFRDYVYKLRNVLNKVT